MSTVFADHAAREDWHKSFLPVSTTTSPDEQRMVYSYANVISGFAARLTENEVKAMQSKDGFLEAYPDKTMKLKTTRSPEFLELNHHQHSVWKHTNYGKGIIIGVIDTGIIPNHPSFSDHGLPPPPKRWKGECKFSTASLCNNKLIGARVFLNGTTTATPIDEDGHGTHVASTAAGMFVHGANVLGQGNGTASGVAPFAHLAIYRVCNSDYCTFSDVLAGIDAAVEDGVDVLSISLGSGPLPFYKDVIAMGTLTAVERGVFVSCAGGNGGPMSGTLSNEAPWILTVAASTIDRSFRVKVKLGNGFELDGESIYQLDSSKPITFFPLVDAIANGNSNSKFCGNGSLHGMNVKGKIVVCETGGDITRIQKGVTVKNAGGFGMILVNSASGGATTDAEAHVLPASHVGYNEGLIIRSYINVSASPSSAFIFKGTMIGTSPAPVMASFSSRGPSIESHAILKPDITGPGMNILAAWPFDVGPHAQTSNDVYYFNVIAGTSMSTPHLSGVASLIKNAHPDWSPAMIKSAIMTTAYIQDDMGNPIHDQQGLPAGLFATGAGHVQPTKANDPGLVYDIDPVDYIAYLCGLRYKSKQVSIIAGRHIDCERVGSISASELNYPTIMVVLSGSNKTVTLRRKVKNVGEEGVYSVKVNAPKGVDVRVEPKRLQFKGINEEKSFTVSFNGGSIHGVGLVEGQLRWISGKRVVRSPICVVFD
ncbi:subtilisin-like protease 4 [Dioscorea cayenensis subsp. rotundata]|uniref:Subtilisin-like protease 4 n=1 Tax=Dioscorea cayennensis subsp. rotundata TaxID=55577 RepID=A0AB40C4Q7_DIOCR|nr:subtilisin-like protease 4 [Dioscorea cayenensis subsp. rotundata]